MTRGEEALSIGADLRRTLGLRTEDEVATALDLKQRTLEQWRVARTGPPFTKVGRNIFYKIESLKAWLDASEQRFD